MGLRDRAEYSFTLSTGVDIISFHAGRGSSVFVSLMFLVSIVFAAVKPTFGQSHLKITYPLFPPEYAVDLQPSYQNDQSTYSSSIVSTKK